MNDNVVTSLPLKPANSDTEASKRLAKPSVSQGSPSVRHYKSWLLTNPSPASERVRRGAGEKKVQTNPELIKVFAEVVDDFTAGDPQRERIKWVSLKPSHLQYKLAQRNYQVSFYIIHQLLNQAGLRRRSYLKSACLKQVPRRDDQFNKIAALKARFLDAGLPVLSIDTKKKELLGNFHRAGHYYDQQPRRVNDHDRATAALTPTLMVKSFHTAFMI